MCDPVWLEEQDGWILVVRSQRLEQGWVVLRTVRLTPHGVRALFRLSGSERRSGTVESDSR